MNDLQRSRGRIADASASKNGELILARALSSAIDDSADLGAAEGLLVEIPLPGVARFMDFGELVGARRLAF